MAKQKTIPELKAEIADNERQLVQLQHKQQQLENRRSLLRKGRPPEAGAPSYHPWGRCGERCPADKGFERNRILHLC